MRIPWWVWLVPPAVGGGVLLLSGDSDPNAPSEPDENGGGGGSSTSARPASRFGVPFAVGGDEPLWPLIRSKHPRRFEVPFYDEQGHVHGNISRAFGVPRPWPVGSRRHVGIDLYANGEDVIVAPESGRVVGRQTLYKGTGGMMVELDSGVNVFLGETLMGGAEEFGVGVGDRVERGQPLTRVGWHDEDPRAPGIQGGAHMLHFEMYVPGTTENEQWSKSSEAPSSLLDPTAYLLRARAASSDVA